jgi:hypothetical protein
VQHCNDQGNQNRWQQIGSIPPPFQSQYGEGIEAEGHGNQASKEADQIQGSEAEGHGKEACQGHHHHSAASVLPTIPWSP